MITVELFTSKTCPHCPKAKLEVERALNRFDDISFKKYRINTPEGRARAAEYRLLGVPAVFVNGKMLKGEITEEKVISFINKIKNPPFFSRIFGKK